MRAATPKAKPPLILCVDADPSVLARTQLELERHGYAVVSATTGHGALESFASAKVAAVVLDYETPGLNGAELAAAMERLNPQVPKLLFTTYRSVPADAAPFIEGFCSKCEGLSGLLSWLRNLIGSSRAGDSSTVSLHAHIAIARLAVEWKPPRLGAH